MALMILVLRKKEQFENQYKNKINENNKTI